MNTICYPFNDKSTTEIIESPDIGPVTINDPGAIFRSRPLGSMIQSVISFKDFINKSFHQFGRFYCIILKIALLKKNNSIFILSLDPFYYYQKNNTSASKGNYLFCHF